jgi:uncharacterized coiled-coil protein SlyX
MSSVTLILGRATFSVGRRLLVGNCDLFGNNPLLTTSPYSVKSPVPLDVFREFIEAIEDKAVDVTNQNVSGLSQLCNEFGFQRLLSKISSFRASPEFKDSADAEARSRILALEERVLQQEETLEAIAAEVSRLAQVGLASPQMQMSSKGQTSPQLRASSEAAQKQAFGGAEQLRSAIASLKVWTGFPDSHIISSFPPLFAEFGRKRFVLLW